MPMETHDAKLVREYRLDPSHLRGNRMRMLTAACGIPVMTVAVQWFADGHFDPKYDLVGVVVGIVSAWFLESMNRRKNRQQWESLVVELRTDRLIRRLEGFPTLEIAPSEITGIVESRSGFVVKTNTRMKSVPIPSALTDYEDLRSRLKMWAPAAVIEHRSVSSTALTILFCLGFLAIAFGIPVYVIQTSHREWVIPLSLLSFTTLLVAILYYRKSPHWPASARWSAWILLLIPLGAMASRLMQ